MPKYKNPTYSILTIIALLLFIISSCVSNYPEKQELVEEEDKNTTSWNYNQLRIIDDIDMDNPASDIIAVYARQKAEQIELRLDFLELSRSSPNEFFIAFDYEVGGSNFITDNIQSSIAWDLLFSSKSKDLIFSDNTIDSNQQSEKSIMLVDDHLDAVFITLPISLITNELSQLKIQVLSKGADSLNQTWDQTNSFSFHGDPPKRRAPLLLMFWNTYNAYTPAQALRSWNGAHIGPIGQRHGLFHLLRAVENYQVPVILLDLKKPISLAALSYADQINWIRSLEQNGLIILPDSAYGDPAANSNSLIYSRKSAELNDLQSTSLAFGPFKSMGFPGEYNTTFSFISNSNYIYSNSGKRIIPLPMPYYLSSENIATELQYKILDENGLTIQAKTQLIQSALLTDKAKITVFGGDLKAGLWADQYISTEVFDYIASHPWIMPLSEEDLLTWKTKKTGNFYSDSCQDILCTPETFDVFPTFNQIDRNTSDYSLPELKNIVRESLLTLTDNAITDSAWAMYLMLTTPSSSLDQQSLQANYLGSVGHLIEASSWYEQPPIASTTTRCEDIDWDGEAECMLYNHTIFTTFEQDGGILFSAFVKTTNGLMQLFGPSSQFVIGTGDPQDWKLNNGLASDPFYLPGAFFGETNKFEPFNLMRQTDNLVFTKQDSQRTYQLQDQKLSIQFQTDIPETVFLTLPNNSNLSSGYPIHSNVKITNNGPDRCEFIVGYNSLDSIKVSLNDCYGLSLSSYTDSIQYLYHPEDPNQIYPEGHFLAFPISILEIQGGKKLEIIITF